MGIVNQINLIFIEHSTQQRQNIHSFQVHTVHSPGQTVFCDIKTSLSTFKMIRVTQNMFSGHNGIELEINTETSLENPQVFGNYIIGFFNSWVKVEVKGEISKYGELNKTENKTSRFVVCR